MATTIDYYKSEMMDKVWSEIKNIASTLVVKLNYMAEREDTVEYKKAAQEYIAAVKMQDNFNTYSSFSLYAISKAELGLECVENKYNIPVEKRAEVLVYQRDYVLKTYVEQNNYYRSLAGLPDLDDTDYVYVTDVSNGNIQNVDETKPVHEMDSGEINILSVLGYLDKLIEKYPDKKYLKHLSLETKIPIYTSRTALNYNILYIYRDGTKQPVSEMFISLYNKSREYVLERFYDKAYAFRSPYYDAYIGLFILSITVQRYITNYIKKFINRDFYDKDIIKILFSSYGLPFYNEIPLSYLQKIAKNLNRLLIYKATDVVFTDIFKIFDMNNITVNNYILFKNPKLDPDDNPVIIYKEVTELGYQIDTTSVILEKTDSFYGEKSLDINNINHIEEINKGDIYCNVMLLNSGIVIFETSNEELKKFLLKDEMCTINDSSQIQFNKYFNITTIKKFIIDDNSEGIYFVCEDKDIVYKFTLDKLEEINIKDILKLEEFPSEVIIKQDETTLDQIFCINFANSSKIYKYNGTEFTLIGDLDEYVVNGDYYKNAISLVMESGKLFLYGDNTDCRLGYLNEGQLNTFTEMNTMSKAIDVKLFSKGSCFIMADGTVRYTREIPFVEIITDKGDTDTVKGYSSIKNLFEMTLDNKKCYFMMTYDGLLYIINYTYSDKFGPLLFESNIENPSCRFRNIKDICQTDSGLIITTYGNESYIGYSGLNTDGNFPFISTLAMIDESNDLSIKLLEIYKGYLFFVTTENDLFVFKGHTTTDLSKFIGEEIVQKLINTEQELFVLVGKNYMFRIFGSTDEDMKIEKITNSNNEIIIDVFREGINYTDLIIRTLDNKIYKYNEQTFVEIENYDIYHKIEATEVIIRTENNKYKMEVTFGDVTYQDITITGPINIERVTINQNILIIEAELIYFIKLNTITEDTTEIEAIPYESLNLKRAKSIRLYDNIVIFNKSGGISVFRNFIHSERLDTQISEDYVSLFDDSIIRNITFDEENIIKLEEKTKYVTYEPVLKEMYDLSFVEVPLDTDELGKYLNDDQYHLDYELVVSDDNLWGGDGDKETFLNEVLEGEYNYVNSKYITITSTYDLVKLNFEVCYMFKMLTELKDAEKYLYTNVKYAGECNLFDVVIAVFAITCKKFGLSGTILDTTTKALSVLGFNFSVDSEYIAKIVKDNKLYRYNEKFKEEDIHIVKNPTLFKNGAEVVNLYLDNRKVMDNIYNYLYESKNIKEFNAYKRIQEASLYSHYTREIYKVEDGYAKTYLDYLLNVNPLLYQLVNDADDENMVEIIDYLLLALSNYIDSEQFEFLFLNIPSLSADLIKRFIYYLVDVFKSYTVDLKAMNVIYHIDDKRIHNLKMIFREEFYGKFVDFDKDTMVDYLDYVYGNFYEYEKIMTRIKTIPQSEWTNDDKLFLFKMTKYILTATNEINTSLFKDFDDLFSHISGTWEHSLYTSGKDGLQGMVHNYILNGIMNKCDYNFMTKFIDLKDSFTERDKISYKSFHEEISQFMQKDINKIKDNIDLIIKMNDKDKIKYLDKLSGISGTKVQKDNIASEFLDTMDISREMTKSDKISVRETYQFIRKE